MISGVGKPGDRAAPPTGAPEDHWLALDPAWAGVREEVLDVRGHPVRVLRADAPDGARQPQLLVHGLGGSAITWIDVIDPLTALGPVVAVDLPGFGQTAVPGPGGSRIAVNAAFLGAVADTLGWDRYTLHGNSMGGLVAALAAARRPGEVAGLVLVSPALVPPPRRLWPVSRMVARRVLPAALPLLGTPLALYALHRLERGHWDAAGLLEQILGGRALRPTLVEALRRERAAAGRPLLPRARALATGARSMVDLLARHRPVHDVVRRIEAPALVLGGAVDPLVPDALLQGLLDARPDWHGEILPGHGHMLMLEDPGRYVELVTAWARARG